ncbi:MAG TPA: XRE family transcriptional regulator [Sulfitobacter litoralis]|uniref:XRE family transcriptional regulator n=2 Tax=root TaxID=1 RepID=A0A7V1BHK3_9RHOB|nr:helix-turn-helix transcriptional regulator [Sulfitobacter litoralis]HDZ53384.1 XRE family transcriptional regulator [Sulfitobacter litoralis]
MSKGACALRILVAREVTGLSQLEVSQRAGIANNALNNMERARQFPNREIMRYYHRAHRIDFNFLMHGDFAQLPMDIQEALFAHLDTRQRTPQIVDGS